MRMDAHQHFWKLERGDYHWLTSELGILYQDFLPHHLLPRLKEHNIDRTILVQAAPSVEETDYMLELYEQNEFIAGVVGWLDLDSSDFPKLFQKYRKHPGFIGLRPMLQDLPDDRWILREHVKTNLRILVEHDFPLDILVFPHHLPHIHELFIELPNLRAVIDHAAKPHIREHKLEPWKEQMTALSRFPKVMCKLSGLITEAEPDNWTVQDLKPYVQHVLEQFGARRVMFGSDWPVCLLAGSYAEVHEALLAALPKTLSPEDHTAIFGKNAAAFYKLYKTIPEEER